jgi:hypothetical protein
MASLQKLKMGQNSQKSEMVARDAHAPWRGVKMGRKPTLTPHQMREAIKQRDHGDETLAEIGRSYNVSGWTIARSLT